MKNITVRTKFHWYVELIVGGVGVGGGGGGGRTYLSYTPSIMAIDDLGRNEFGICIRSSPNSRVVKSMLGIWQPFSCNGKWVYRNISNIRRTNSQNLKDSSLLSQFSLLIPFKSGGKNGDVVGAAPTGDAPTTTVWSTNLFAYWGAT